MKKTKGSALVAAPEPAGGMDSGKPEVQTEYPPNYYGAFVLDPDGHHVEAVYHEAVSGKS